MMSGFWNGFEKKSSILGVYSPTDAISTMFGGSTRRGMETSGMRAENEAREVSQAIRNRKMSPFQYLLNPEIAGPIAEIMSRAERRYQAARAERPVLTGLLPFYGLARGGSAGEDIIEEGHEDLS